MAIVLFQLILMPDTTQNKVNTAHNATKEGTSLLTIFNVSLAKTKIFSSLPIGSINPLIWMFVFTILTNISVTSTNRVGAMGTLV